MPPKPPIKDNSGNTLLRVRVQPKASRDQLTVQDDGTIRVAIAAPAVDNQANKAVRAFLAKRLGVSKSAITLTHGAKSREKTFQVDGVSANEVRQALRPAP
jgi:hypothetical protein